MDDDWLMDMIYDDLFDLGEPSDSDCLAAVALELIEKKEKEN